MEYIIEGKVPVKLADTMDEDNFFSHKPKRKTSDSSLLSLRLQRGHLLPLVRKAEKMQG